jgi:hypothetical protein
MQNCSVSVRLNGDMTQQLTGKIVTVAEIPILQRIHGQDAVFDIAPTKQALQIAEEVAEFAERDRLIQVYGVETVEDVYPGAGTKLPTSLADLDINASEQVEAMLAQAKRLTEMADAYKQTDEDAPEADDLL